MKDGGIGRVLVASLHQGIAELLPSRLDFYENWLNPVGLRDGTIGLAPLVAVLSFLRREGEVYDRVVARAGAYAGDWTVDALSPLRRAALAGLPAPLRRRAALQVCRRLVTASYAGSRAALQTGAGRTELQLKGSIFCGVREPVGSPLCGFYAAACSRVFARLRVPFEARIVACRATGGPGCLLGIHTAACGAPSPEPAGSAYTESVPGDAAENAPVGPEPPAASDTLPGAPGGGPAASTP